MEVILILIIVTHAEWECSFPFPNINFNQNIFPKLVGISLFCTLCCILQFQKADVPWKAVFTCNQFWVGVIAAIGNDWGFHMFCNFGPKYIKTALGFDLEQVRRTTNFDRVLSTLRRHRHNRHKTRTIHRAHVSQNPLCGGARQVSENVRERNKGGKLR